MKDIIKYYGYHWVILGLFVVICLIAGFVVFPSLVFLYLFNKVSLFFTIIPKINLIGALLLWGIIFLSLYIGTKDLFVVSYQKGKKMSRKEIKEIMRGLRRQGITGKMVKNKYKIDKNK